MPCACVLFGFRASAFIRFTVAASMSSAEELLSRAGDSPGLSASSDPRGGDCGEQSKQLMQVGKATFGEQAVEV